MEPLQMARLLAVTATLALIGFAVALLAVQNTPRRDQALWLAGFLGLYGLVKADEFLHAMGTYLVVPHLSGVIFPIMMLLGPAIYFYARAMTAPRPHPFVRRELRALAGLVIVLAVNAHFYLMSAEAKLALMTRQADAAEIALARFRCDLLFSLFLAFSIGYLVAAFRLFLQHARRIETLFSNIEDKSLAWLRAVLLFLAAGWSWDTVGEIWSLNGGAPDWFGPMGAIFELGWLSAIAFFGMLQRPVFETVPPPVEAGKYSRSALSQEAMIRIAGNLELAMTRDRLFEDPDLSLRALSDRLGVSENYLSQTLNKQLGKNFFDFVNSHRVAEARRQLEQTGETVLAIAFAVGFNSRSTFNAAFKKHAGVTPSAYRHAVKAGALPPIAAAATPNA